MRASFFRLTVAALLFSQSAFAAPLTCDIQRVCGNDAPCKSASITAEIVEVDDSLLVSLESQAPVALTSHELTEDLVLRGTGNSTKGSTGHMLTVFTDLTLFYSTHSFVGQGVVVTMLGSCQRNKT